jgi:broad specificity phosphatase PhoE
MSTTLYLVRNAATEWSREKRVAGRRDLPLSAEGRAQAEATAVHFRELELAEVLSSPLPRAVETADAIASPHKLDVARDPRLTDLHAGRWEGLRHAEIAANDEYKAFLNDPVGRNVPGGEPLVEVRDRMISSVGQALVDNELGANVVIVSHAAPLRVLIAHYLGMNVAHYHRLRLSPASVTALRFDAPSGVPRLLTLNCLGELKTTTS